MDIFPTEFAKMSLTLLKVVFLLSGSIIAAVSYFHVRETKKIEKRMEISLPGSVHVMMSAQLLFSTIFVFFVFLLLFWP